MAGVDFPTDPPDPKTEPTPEALLKWAATATNAGIERTWRPGHTEHAPLLIRLDSGREIFFETINDATSAKRFFAAFIAVGCVPMRSYSEPQVRLIVSALVRAAQLSDELDERDYYEDTGATFARRCLTVGNTQTVELAPTRPEGRLALYRAAVRYDADLGRLSEDAPPRMLVAVDVDKLLVPRGAFLTFANRRRRGVSPATISAQMRRVGWEVRDLRPRKPKAPEGYPRPHLRLWEIPNGWDGLHVEIEAGQIHQIADSGPLVPPGPSGARAPARRAPVEAGPGGTTGPNLEMGLEQDGEAPR